MSFDLSIRAMRLWQGPTKRGKEWIMPAEDNTLGISGELEDELSTLIDRMYGDDDDETPDDTPAEPTEGDDEATAQADEAGDDDHPETDVDTDDGEEADDSEPDDTDEAEAPTESDDGDDSDAETVEETVPTFTVKVNGDEREITSDELIRSYQKAAAADEKFRAAAEKERELKDYVDFATGFAEAIENSPEQLLAEYVELTDDPNKVIVAIVERVAAAGKLHPEIAERLGVDDQVISAAKAKLAEQRAEAAERKAEQATAEKADDWGYTQSQYEEILPEILSTAGLADASLDDQRAFVSELANFRAERNIANPYLAYAQMREQKSGVTAAEAAAKAAATAVTTATKKASKSKRIPAASASSGQRTAETVAPDGPIYDHRAAAEAAYAELFGDK